jgi:hypothetical protein
MTQLFYIQNNDLAIANFEFLLIFFELLSGLKINFLKSEVIVTEAPDEEQTRVENLLNCREGSFLITYLGFPIADRKLMMIDWEGLVALVGHLVDPWMGRFMSSVACLTLPNSSLSSLPTYAMGLFLLADGSMRPSINIWLDFLVRGRR